jgi:hypothetical protein
MRRADPGVESEEIEANAKWTESEIGGEEMKCTDPPGRVRTELHQRTQPAGTEPMSEATGMEANDISREG